MNYHHQTRPQSFLDITDRGNPSDYHKADFRDLDIELNLSPTLLSFLPEDELIVYWRGLYHLSSVSKGDSQKISIGGTVYSMVKSEFFLDLEKDYLKRNQKEIERFKEEYIKRLAQENAVIKEKYDSLKSSLKDGNSLDSLVKNYFFPITKNMDLEEIISENESRENAKRKIDTSQIQEIQFNHLIPFFESLLPDGDMPLLITGGKCYSLSPDPVFVKNLRTLEKKYKESISEKIKNKIRSSVNFYLNKLVSEDRDFNDLNEKIHSATSGPRKDFGADRISDDEYVLFKEIGEYGVEVERDFYLFPPLKVGVTLVKTSRGYNISEDAFAYESPQYKHPYIQGEVGWERRKICNGGTLNRIQSEIDFISHSNSNRDKAHLMRSAKALLLRFENILVAGHNSPHYPFDTIRESARLLSGTEVQTYQNRGVMFFRKVDGN